MSGTQMSGTQMSGSRMSATRSTTPATTVPAAIVQARPVYYDLPASLELALDWMQRAAELGAQLVVLGETWLPGYPAWLDYVERIAQWDRPETKEVYARLAENSIAIPSAESKRLGSHARDLGIVLVIGVNERVDHGLGYGTLYNSILTFDANGQLVNHHRKLVPTYTERLIWGQGDGAGLRAIPTAFGRLSSLVCWEHWMPLARQALHESGEQIHAALWPTVKEMHQVASRQYAFEGRCFVLAAGSILRAEDTPPELELPAALADAPDSLVMNGGSAIIAPDGSYLAGPLWDEEGILSAELDLRSITREQMTLDVSGHYSRPDVFRFRVRRKRPR